MMHYLFVHRIVFITTVLGLTLAGCSTSLPPLLIKATAGGGGWSSVCPSQSEKGEISGVHTIPPKGSPEVEQRLRDEFPPGSNDGLLVAALTAQGFKMQAPCENDSTIQRASFYQKSSGILPSYTGAIVYWKSDGQHRIIWTKGYVSYGGL